MINDKECGVYAVRRVDTNQRYIGGTTRPFHIRWQAHVRELNDGRHANPDLQTDWSALGQSAFVFEIVESIIDQDLVFQREHDIITDLLDQGDFLYNKAPSNVISGRGGSLGGGSIVRRLDISEKAARYVKRRATISGPRYRKEEANQTASAILEALADGTLIHLMMSPDLRAALPWLEEAKRLCPSEDAQRGFDQLIAAIWTAAAGEDGNS